MKSKRSYNVQMWVGLREEYSDRMHSIEEVQGECIEHTLVGDCVTVTPTTFIYKNGFEAGAIVGYIQYPRFPRSRVQIRKRAFLLARKLMRRLGQLRVSVTTPYKTYMFERDE